MGSSPKEYFNLNPFENECCCFVLAIANFDFLEIEKEIKRRKRRNLCNFFIAIVSRRKCEEAAKLEIEHLMPDNLNRRRSKNRFKVAQLDKFV